MYKNKRSRKGSERCETQKETQIEDKETEIEDRVRLENDKEKESFKEN